MTLQQPSFGVLLRRWRERRRITQIDLAFAADSSTRHLSCLETGKAQPSREMIGRLAQVLEVPLRERNDLMLAAGFAPVFRETKIDELSAARSAMDRVLQAHKPYPAFVVDRHWNVVLSNGALPQLYEGCAQSLLAQPVNAMRLILHPQGMGPRILNYAAWKTYSLDLMQRQIEANADPVLSSLRSEVAAYRIPGQPDGPVAFDETDRLATPLRIATRLGVMSFLNTLTIFGTANDVTLSELALEMLFPADEQTIDIAARMATDQAQTA